jgi:hypothetical protein
MEETVIADAEAAVSLAEFRPCPKIFRLFRPWAVSEKIDGTNAVVIVDEWGGVRAGNKNRLLSLHNDNHGFARWVSGNRSELLKLGPGYHRGEWWGARINRGYGLTGDERYFSLFDTERWADPSDPRPDDLLGFAWSSNPKEAYSHPIRRAPGGCRVVPLLEVSTSPDSAVLKACDFLKRSGSFARKGYDNPEGVVAWHLDSGVRFKFTLGGDGHKRTPENVS